MDFVLQLLGLAYFVFALWNLRLAVLMLPLFFPAYLLKFDVAGVPFPMVEVFIYGAFFAWILRTGRDFFQRKISFKEIFFPYRSRWWLAVLGIVAAAAVSTFITPQSVVMMDGNTVFYGRKVALGILKSWIVAPVLMFVLFAWVMRTAKDMGIALNAYVVSSVLVACWGIYQVLTGQYVTPDLRASGPFNSANYLALYITPALFYALVRVKDYFMVEHLPWWKKILHALSRRHEDDRPQFFYVLAWIAGFLLLFFALLFTKSYAAFLAFVFAILVLSGSYVKGWKRFPWKVVGVGVVALVLVASVMIVLDPAKWELFFQLGTRTSSGVRVEIYAIAARLLLENPLQGIGLGMFPAAYQLEGPSILGHAPYEWNMLHPHNIFLAFWLNLGLVGFLSFMALAAACVQKGWRFVKDYPRLVRGSLEWFHAVGLLMLVIILVHGFVDTPFFKNDLALLFWLTVAMMLFPKSGGKEGR